MNTIVISTRGASKQNPGPAAIGVRVTDQKGVVILEAAQSIGNATSGYAEYFAVVRGLQLVLEKYGEKTKKMDFELRQESELVDNHLQAKAEITDVSLIGHFIEIYNMRVASFPNLTHTLVSREDNTEADRLVSEVLDA